MYTERTVKQVKSGGILVYKVHNWIGDESFYFCRSCKKYTLEQFLQEVNETFIKKYGFEANFRVKNLENSAIPQGKREIKSKRTDYEVLISNRWSSLNQRSVNGVYANEPSVQSNLQHISYKKKDIRLEMTKEEFYTWMMSVKHIHDEIVANGDKSSINRIDPNIGYSLDNIELIALHKNIEERYGKKCEYNTDKDVIKRYNAKSYRKSQNKGDE